MISQLTQGHSRLMAPSCGCPDFGGGDESGSWFDASVKIERQPNDASEYDGSKVIFSVKASGVGPLVYRWQYCATEAGSYSDVPGGFLRVLEIASMSESIVGFYRCVVSNPSGKSATSRSASLERLVHVPPQITRQPVGGTYESGTVKSLSISAIGSSKLSYQWYLNGLPISGGTAAGYSFMVSDSSVGSYHCVVTNKFGTATSSTAGVLAIDENENTLLLVQVDSGGNIEETTGNGTITTVGAVVVDPTVTHDGYGSIRNAALGETRPYPPVYISGVKVVSNDLDLTSFTIEGWFYLLENRANNILIFFQLRSSTGGTEYFGLMDMGTSTENVVVALGGAMDIEHKLTIPLNTWTHLAFSGENDAEGGTSIRYFVDGELVFSGVSVYPVAAGMLTLGCPADFYFPMGCCFENIRVSNIARYTENFTPPGRF